MKTNLIITLLIFRSFGLFAQKNTVIDSLLEGIKQELVNLEKEKIYRKLCIEYGYLKEDSLAILYGLKSLEICKVNPKIKNKEFLYYTLAERYYHVSLEETKKYYDLALIESKRTKNDTVLNLTYYGLGGYYSAFSMVDSSLHYILKATKHYEHIKDTFSILNCYYNMMTIYSTVSNFDKIIEYGTKCEDILKNFGDIYFDGELYAILSHAYNNSTKNYDTAKATLYIIKAEEIAKKKERWILLLRIYQVKGYKALREKNYKKAIRHYNEAFKIAENKGGDFNVSMVALNLGLSYFHAKDKVSAIKYLSKVDIVSGGEKQKKAYLYLSLLYSNNDTELSSFYIAKHDSLQKQLTSEKNKELLVKYESLEKEKENLALSNEVKDKKLIAEKYKRESQRNKFYLLIGIVFSLLTFAGGILYFRQKRMQARNKIIALQKQALQLQLNPHFFFNALNSINAYVGDQKAEKAKYYLGKFSRLMRLTLENSQQESVTLEDELDFIENYLALEQMNSNNFEYSINVDEELLDIEIPSMLLQPFVENSIEHAFNGMDEKGEITIQITEKEECLTVIITDNGIGLTSTNKNKEHKSIALSLLEKRITLYSKGKSSIEFSVPFSKQKNKGAQIKFDIPFAI